MRRMEGSRVMASDDHPLGANLHSISSNGTKEPEAQKVLLEAQIPSHELLYFQVVPVVSRLSHR
jgi:hypothetical protein